MTYKEFRENEKQFWPSIFAILFFLPFMFLGMWAVTYFFDQDPTENWGGTLFVMILFFWPSIEVLGKHFMYQCGMLPED